MESMEWITKFSTVFIILSMLSHKLVLTDENNADGLKEVVFVQNNKKRMVTVAYNDTGITHCSRYGDKHVVKMLLEAIPNGTEVQYVNSTTMDTLMELGASKETHVYNSLFDAVKHFGQWIKKKFQSLETLIHEFFIYPGTKWCGPGNVASGHDDLGTHAKADACCRKHDKCNDTIYQFQTKHGLKNPNMFLKLNCRCDDELHDCMEKANTKTSKDIGKMYFNDIKQPCFKKDHPCLHHALGGSLATFLMKICKREPLNTTEEPVWQYFAALHFDTSTADKEQSNN